MITPRPHSRLLNWYVWVVVAATFFLLFVGAMVTSKDAGLSVPDWPLSYGSLNPPGWWKVENVFWEHGHRITGAVIGLLTIGLTVAVWRTYANSWIRWLGVLALFAVIVQGVMGGLRVTQMSVTLAIVHGCFAQAFFALLLLIAALTSPGMTGRAYLGEPRRVRGLRFFAGILVAMVYLQLILGATMRHLKVGLAIPDFPLAMGRLIPEFTNHGVVIHYMHRVWAVVIVFVAVWLFVRVLRSFRAHRSLVRTSALLLVLLAVQIALGASVIWMFKAPLPTSLHVVNGAAVLGVTVWLAVYTFTAVPRSMLIAGKDGAQEATA